MDISITEYLNKVYTKVDLLVKNYTLLQKENVEMKARIQASVENEKRLKESIELLQQKQLILMASLSKMEEPDKKIFQTKIDQYIKDIDKCITVLSQ